MLDIGTAFPDVSYSHGLATDCGGQIAGNGWPVEAAAARLEAEAAERGISPMSLWMDAVQRQQATAALMGGDLELDAPAPVAVALRAPRRSPVTDSPIEEALLTAILSGAGWDDVVLVDGAYLWGGWTIETQRQVGRYRVDIAITSDTARIAIEADGHDYHERTKQQAAHDRRRDRWFLANDWLVLRFTGSEIYRDPAGCAAEVLDLLRSRGEG